AVEALHATYTCSRGTCSTKDGSTALCAAKSCLDILTLNPSSTDGTYWIDSDGPAVGDPVRTTCDMTTDGGGWTLIESTSMGATRVLGAGEVPQAQVLTGTSTHMEHPLVVQLAKNGSQIHIRTT